jgi:deoxyribodipyrimidine photo-lyase
MPHRIIVWFRQDLRLHDNEALVNAIERADEVIPVYVFDERMFNDKTKYGFPKTGKYRAKFILESVEDLRKSFRKAGIDLVVRVGKPEEEVFKIVREMKAEWVYCNRERMQEEEFVQDALEKNLWSIGVELQYYRGKMLYYTQDLPFPVLQTPDIFSNFRKETEHITPVRDPLLTPPRFSRWTFEIDKGQMPTLKDLGYQDYSIDNRTAYRFKGGESHALERLHYYLWESHLIDKYKETRNGLIGPDYSSKFSPWLALGCLSPKLVYHEIRRYESEYKPNDSTYALIFELLWRDFFRLMGKKYPVRIFMKGGLRNLPVNNLTDDMDAFWQWAEGRTGVPFVDANMHELNATGFMSNRGRQNVASYLVKDMHVNWQIGAEYFESLLIDYDVCSNYGNWNYIAGVGNDPREDRYFNPQTQSKQYDPNGDYVALWG